MKTKKEIITALEELKTIEDLDLVDIAQHLEETSNCIVVDQEELEKAVWETCLNRGYIGFLLEPVGTAQITLNLTFERFIKEGVELARDLDSQKQFVKDARRLAKMLKLAATRLEKEAE